MRQTLVKKHLLRIAALACITGFLSLSGTMAFAAIICQNNFRHSFSLTWSGKTCDIRRSL